MKKRLVLSLLVSMLLVTSAGCTTVNQIKNLMSPAPEAGPYSQALRDLFPDKPYAWVYEGTAGYRHQMSIMDVFGSSQQQVIRIAGEVSDQTRGQTSASFTFSLDYIVSEDRLVQKQAESPLMDSEYTELTLIQLPLTVGNTWEETVYDATGKAYHITGEITDIQESDKGYAYTVTYTRSQSAHVEERIIETSIGVTRFSKMLIYDGATIPVSYELTNSWSGISAAQLTEGKQQSEKESAQEQQRNDVEPSDPDLEQDEQASDSVNEEGAKEQLEAHATDEEQVTMLIHAFNQAWIDYVNEGTRAIDQYVTEDGFASRVVEQYKRGISRQKFEEIRIDDIRIQDDLANVKVYERILKITGEVEEVLEYHWIYEARKVDQTWLIHGYASDPDYQ